MTTIALVTFCLSGLLFSAAKLGHNYSKKRSQK